MTLRHRLGTSSLEVHSPAGALLVAHRLSPAGSGEIVRTPEHKAALEKAVLDQFTNARPCDRKENTPPGAAALAERAKLAGGPAPEPEVDLEALAQVILAAFPGSQEVTE